MEMKRASSSRPENDINKNFVSVSITDMET